MECKCKKLLGKGNAECNTPNCELCWYQEKYNDLMIEAMIEMAEESREWE